MPGLLNAIGPPKKSQKALFKRKNSSRNKKKIITNEIPVLEQSISLEQSKSFSSDNSSLSSNSISPDKPSKPNSKRKGKDVKRRRRRRFSISKGKTFKKLLARHKRIEELNSFYDGSSYDSELDSWASSVRPMKSLRKMAGLNAFKSWKRVDTSSAFIATLPNLQHVRSDPNSIENPTIPDEYNDDGNDGTFEAEIIRPKIAFENNKQNNVSANELLSFLQEQEKLSSVNTIDVDLELLELAKQHEIKYINNTDTEDEDVSLLEEDEFSISDKTPRVKEIFKTIALTAVAIISISCAIDILLTISFPIIKVLSTLISAFTAYATYQQWYLSDAKEQEEKAQKLMQESEKLLEKKRILLGKLRKLERSRERLNDARDKLSAMVAGTPNSLKTISVKAKAYEFVSSELKTCIRSQVIYLIFKSMHLSSRRNDELALTPIGVEVITRKLASLEYLEFYPDRFGTFLLNANFSNYGILSVIKQLFDEKVPPTEQIFKLPPGL